MKTIALNPACFEDAGPCVLPVALFQYSFLAFSCVPCQSTVICIPCSHPWPCHSSPARLGPAAETDLQRRCLMKPPVPCNAREDMEVDDGRETGLMLPRAATRVDGVPALAAAGVGNAAKRGLAGGGSIRCQPERHENHLPLQSHGRRSICHGKFKERNG